MDVAEWLLGLGLEQYARALRNNDIGSARRPTAEDLHDLGSASIAIDAAWLTRSPRWAAADPGDRTECRVAVK